MHRLMCYNERCVSHSVGEEGESIRQMIIQGQRPLDVPERAASVTLVTDKLASEYDDPSLTARREELKELVRTAGGHVVMEIVQTMRKPNPATFIGTGKAEEVARAVRDEDIELVVFNHELSPGQQNNLQGIIAARIVDRTRLILDIFAQRAQSREGKYQVELAQLTYLLPRLMGMGQELSRLGGGIGTRGPGETKLETDRRRVRRRMTDLHRKIEGVRQHRGRIRERRQKDAVPLFAVVGYTNAGKSTLINRLTGSDQLAEDRLFATLDPLVRKTTLPPSTQVCLADTVGFVRDLPEQLVTAFMATLEEINEADYLIHVVDISHRDWPEQVSAVERLLRELEIDRKETVTALNKVDALQDPADTTLLRDLPNPVLISALYDFGLDDLRERMAALLAADRTREAFDVPYIHMEIVDELHRHGEVHLQEYRDDGVHLHVTLDRGLARRVRSRLLEQDGHETGDKGS